MSRITHSIETNPLFDAYENLQKPSIPSSTIWQHFCTYPIRRLRQESDMQQTDGNVQQADQRVLPVTKNKEKL